MKTVVFAGPSLWDEPVEVLRHRLNAIYLAPVRRGDLAAAVADGATDVAIIDGEFGQSLSVSVAEIRTALRSDVRVWGAASMGALRGVECRSLGMVGVGWIYEKFTDGTLASDDEVALVFNPRTREPLSIPLVNFRWTMQLCLEAGLLENCELTSLLTCARRMRFAERTQDSLMRHALESGVEHAMNAMMSFINDNPAKCDRKRLDALSLLDRMAERSQLCHRLAS